MIRHLKHLALAALLALPWRGVGTAADAPEPAADLLDNGGMERVNPRTRLPAGWTLAPTPGSVVSNSASTVAAMVPTSRPSRRAMKQRTSALVK